MNKNSGSPTLTNFLIGEKHHYLQHEHPTHQKNNYNPTNQKNKK